MANYFQVSRTLGRRLQELEVSPISVLRRANLPPGLFEQSKIRMTTGEMFSLYDAIYEISGDPGIGLKLGSEDRIERYDPIAIAAVHARTFRDALPIVAAGVSPGKRISKKRRSGVSATISIRVPRAHARGYTLTRLRRK